MVRVSALILGGRRFEPWPRHTKDFKMVWTASLFDVRYLKRIEHGETTIRYQS